MKNILLITAPASVAFTSQISNTSRNVLDAMIWLMTAEDNVITFAADGLYTILAFCAELDKAYTEKTIQNSVYELVMVGLLISISSNKFQVNSTLFRKIEFPENTTLLPELKI